MARNTSTGKDAEKSIVMSLERGGYSFNSQVKIPNIRPNNKNYIIDYENIWDAPKRRFHFHVSDTTLPSFTKNGNKYKYLCNSPSVHGTANAPRQRQRAR